MFEEAGIFQPEDLSIDEHRPLGTGNFSTVYVGKLQYESGNTVAVCVKRLKRTVTPQEAMQEPLCAQTAPLGLPIWTKMQALRVHSARQAHIPQQTLSSALHVLQVRWT